MATWTNILTSSLEPGKPIRSVDGLALRDNPVAIAEGADGAPRVVTLALETLAPGTEIKRRHDDVQSTAQSDSPGVLILLTNFIQYGTIRITFENRGTTTQSTATITRTRAGVETTINTYVAGTTFTAHSEDIEIKPGDRLTVYHYRSGASGNSEIRNLRLRTSGGQIWPVSHDANYEGF